MFELRLRPQTSLIAPPRLDLVVPENDPRIAAQLGDVPIHDRIEASFLQPFGYLVAVDNRSLRLLIINDSRVEKRANNSSRTPVVQVGQTQRSVNRQYNLSDVRANGKFAISNHQQPRFSGPNGAEMKPDVLRKLELIKLCVGAVEDNERLTAGGKALRNNNMIKLG